MYFICIKQSNVNCTKMSHHVLSWPCSSSACWPSLGGSSLAWRHSTGCWGSKTSPAQDSSRWDTQCRHTELTGPAGRGQPWWGRWRSGRQAARPSLLPSQIFWRQSLTRNKISEIDKSFGVLSQGWNVYVLVFYSFITQYFFKKYNGTTVYFHSTSFMTIGEFWALELFDWWSSPPDM